MSLLARLKPYNERKRHLTRTYMIDGARFFAERGWYEVSDAMGQKLRTLKQDYHDEDSPNLFDVCTQQEAEALEQREVEAETKASAKRPASVASTRRITSVSTEARNASETGDMTSADVTQASPSQAPKMIDPDPNGEELSDADAEDGRIAEVGRVSPSGGKSTPPGPKERRRTK